MPKIGMEKILYYKPWLNKSLRGLFKIDGIDVDDVGT